MLKPSLASAARRLWMLSALSVLLLAAAGCAHGPEVVTPDPPPIPDGGPPVPENNEVVLSDGTQIVADAPWGRIKIEAGPGLRRVYTWRGNRRGVLLEPRGERFAGSLGIHYDGKPPVWEDADGITKVQLEEGQHDFQTMDDAMIWMQIRRLRYSYTNDGIVIGWKPDGDTLKVELWQFYIDGKKPTHMPGADDARISIGPLDAVPQKMAPMLVFEDGHTEPYTTEAAAEYPNARAAPGSETASQASDCNWFQRLFNQCTAAPPEPIETTTAVATADNAAETAPQPPPPAQEPAPVEVEAEKEAEETHPQAKISGKVVNVRSRPTTNSKVLSQARKGDAVKILKEEKDWRYVEFDDGHKGWVANFLLDHSG